MANRFFASLGSNVGDSFSYLQQAVNQLNEICSLLNISSVWKTQAWGLTEQNDFLNIVLEAESNLLPLELLFFFQNIENQLNRTRIIHWGPRTVDIDLLSYENEIIETQTLTIPHPLISSRLFVLAPWNEISSHYKLPNQNKSIAELLKECHDYSKIEIMDKNIIYSSKV